MRGASYQLGCEPVSPPIGEALPADVGKVHVGTNAVILFAGVVAEIELRRVAMQVALAKVVIGADHATLEDRKEVLDRVAVVDARGDIFLRSVVGGAMLGELFAKTAMPAAAIRAKPMPVKGSTTGSASPAARPRAPTSTMPSRRVEASRSP